MSRNLSDISQVTEGVVCTHPGFLDRVNQYLEDPLNSEGAQEVEDHLLDCRACREFVDTVISIRGKTGRTVIRGDDDLSYEDLQVTKISTFRKEHLQNQ